VNTSQWKWVRATFDEVVGLEAADRATRLGRLSGDDPHVGRWVQALLDGDERAADYLDPVDALFAPKEPADAESADAASATDPLGLAGAVLSHFRIVALLGVGGMGIVYRAEDLRLRRTVALKFLHPAYSFDSAARARFLLEARSVATLDHPNICAVHEAGESDGRAFIAMPCYAGETVRARLTRERSFTPAQATEIATQVARGLTCAHDAGIIHRDLKPANLLIVPDGNVKILDFGLAKVRDVALSGPGVRMGTVAYMSPEQLGGGLVDTRADLWSLGVVLFEMLTGVHPSHGGSLEGLLNRKSNPRLLHAPLQDIPDALARIVDRLLQIDLASRYSSAHELLADLTSLPAVAGAPLGGRLRWPENAPARLAWAGVAILVLLGSGVGALLWLRDPQARAAHDMAGASTPAARYSLAVLPLKNYSGDTRQDYFADGMTEELTTTLAKIGGLRVIAHQSVAQFKKSNRPVPDIARLLGVRHVVDGSVTQAGDRVRITAALIDAARNAPVWSERFERDRHDVMTLRHEVALAIARAIEIALTPQDVARFEYAPRVNPEAFEHYLRGMQSRYAGAGTGDFRTAAAHFERAIAADSGYAPAYAGLAVVRALDLDEARARPLTAKALGLDPTLPEARLALGMLRQFLDWDWAGAESALRDAIRLNPGYTEAHHELSMLLMRRGRFDEAMRQAQLTVYMAPMSARFEIGLAQVRYFSGRYEEALKSVERAIAFDPTYATAYCPMRGHMLLGQRKYADATKVWNECSASGADVRPDLAYVYAIAGHRDKALSLLDTLRARWHGGKPEGARDAVATNIATVLMGLDEREQALDWLERSAVRGHWTVYLGINPIFRPLHAEPRFRAILKRVGLGE
jgi:serine/threonine protein kinase/TolB-like protein/Flp pilus assembly protein TadD